MQESSREELSLLNGVNAAASVTAKDMCPTLICNDQNVSSLNSTDATQQRLAKDDNSEIIAVVPVKLEDINTMDLFPSNSNSWQQYQIHDLGNSRPFQDTRSSFQHNSANLLLQGSDDPLISHGANSVLTNDDEHLADFAKSLITQANNKFQSSANQQECGERLFNPPEQQQPQQQEQQQPPRSAVKSGCSSLTRQQLKAKANLMSARNQRQQLQKQQQQQNQNSTAVIEATTEISCAQVKHQQRTQKGKSKKGSTLKLRFHHQALPPEYLSHYEATQGQLRTCTKSTHNLKATAPRNSAKPSNSLQKPTHSRNSHENVRSWLQKIAEIQRAANATKESTSSAMQKPPPEKQHSSASHTKPNELQNVFQNVQTDANNNLNMPKSLEMPKVIHLTDSNTPADYLAPGNNRQLHSKRLHYSELPYMGEITLDNFKPRRGRKPKKADICHLIYKNYGTILPKKTETETRPNYAAIRQTLDQPLNLCLRDQVNDSYSISSGDELSETNSSCPTPVSTPFDAMRDTMLATNLKKSLTDINEHKAHQSASEVTNQTLALEKEPFVQPITLCLKKLLDSGLLLHNGSGRYKTIRKDNQLALKIPIPSGALFPTGKPEKYPPKQITLHSEYGETTAAASCSQTECLANLNQSHQQLLTAAAPQKRKRSAIFIPPMNVENTNNPATEVSICKFKFTGGSKPSLEEKKMISVDAGGNYRYFSGTGDKASRGFEYFPREVLQHTAGLLPGVNCAGHKSFHDIPPPSHGMDHDLLQIPEPAATSALLTGRSLNVSTDAVSPASSFEPNKSQTLYGT